LKTIFTATIFLGFADEFSTEKRNHERGTIIKTRCAVRGSKEARAHQGYAPVPQFKALGRAYGQNRRDIPTDEELSLSLDERNTEQRMGEQDQ
jgi:hypothetical protein